MTDVLIYEGVTGFVIDIVIVGVESLEGVSDAKIHALPPDGGPEEEWDVTVIEDEFVFRHIVPTDNPLKNGVYRLQPSFKLLTFHGRWEPVSIRIQKKQSLV